MARPFGIDALAGSTVAVWGTGTEGRAMIRLARARGARVTVLDDRAEGGSVLVPGEDLDVYAPAILAGTDFDVVVRSPGVSRYRPELTAARQRGATVTTAMALWLSDFADRRVIAVTGSKGKSTTVTLAAAVLGAGGLRVAMGGNIGKPVTDFYDEDDHDVYVVEVSSFQAAEVTVSPPVGVLTLVAPDHLDWHGTEERYIADKVNLFLHRADIEVAVNADDPGTVAASAGIPAPTFYGGRGRVTLDAHRILVDGEPYLPASALALRGPHNLVNLCGALTAVLLAGEPLPEPAAVTDALAAVSPLPSRLQTVAVHGGLEFVDDALASNPAGTIAALRSFPGRRVCLIAGGHDRGVAQGPLVRELAQMEPAPTVVVVGPTAPDLAALLAREAPALDVLRADTLEAAVRLAADNLHTGGPDSHVPVVLFSPAAPTPPAEGSYVDRSRAFRRGVEAVAAPTTA